MVILIINCEKKLGLALADIFMKNTKDNDAYHILIVEDDDILGGLIKEALNQHYKTTLLNEATEVLSTLQEQSIDLVVLDLMLPDVDGFELLTEIRQQYSPEKLAVVILSAIDDAKSIVHGFENGASDYIVKPVEVSVMIARIRTQLKLLTLQEERREYIKSLEKSEHLRKQLNQIASHDLKNPLNNLRMAEGLIREETHENPRLQQLLSTMNASLNMMEQVVGTFLDVMAIQTQNITLKFEPILIRDLINNAYTQYELVADKKSIKMTMGNTDGIVLADAGRMAQIAGNLVSNAIKYSPAGSEICTWGEVRDGILRLNVEDSGEGVPENERHLLFKEFSKLSTRPTANEGSTGLGLWIVKHLIELQGGTAGADFPEDAGSIFWIELPLAKIND